MPARCITPLAALLAAIAVGLGAYSAHGLDKHLESAGYEANLTERLDWFETGVRYHLYHALGLLLVGAMASREGAPKALSFASAAFLLGIVLFSGSLYAMSLAPDGWSKLGAVVPLGGLSFIIGWIILAGATWKR